MVRAAVLGAGAVGCYYGGMLARAGNDVTLIGRPAHVDAVRARGLRFEALGFDETVAVRASTEPAAVRGAQLVLFSVKSTDTDEAAAQMAPHLEPGAIVVSLQNGVDNVERLQARLAQPVLGAAVYVASEMAGPGHLKHHGRGDLVIGGFGRALPEGVLAQARAWLEGAGIAVTVSPNVAGELWAKLVANCAYNALSAIARMPYGKMIQVPGVRDVMRDVIDETLAVAKASGVVMAADVAERTFRIADAMPTQYSSTAQDLARGKRTEIEHLNGYVVRRGEALGVPTPANRALAALVRAITPA